MATPRQKAVDSDTDVLTDSDFSSEPVVIKSKPVKSILKKSQPSSKTMTISDSETEKTTKSKGKTPVKRTASTVRKPRATKKQKIDNTPTLKNILCQWSQDEDCMNKILQGKKIVFVPVFI